jgi:proline iminopeptidase
MKIGRVENARPKRSQVGRVLTWKALAALIAFAAALTAIAACVSPASVPSACAAKRVDDAFVVPVPGAELSLRVRGSTCSGPPLLWLHGGPGGAETPLFQLYAGELERYRLVAYWDQRGAGRSYDPKADTSRLTTARHLADLNEVVDALRKRYNFEKLVLIGHSWGAALGLLYAQDQPEKVAAIIAVNPLVSGVGAQEGQFRFAQERAAEIDDRKARRTLAEIGPPPLAPNEVLKLQHLVDRFGGYFHRRPSKLGVLFEGALRGVVAPWEIAGFIRANEASLVAMHDELVALDLDSSVDELKVPVAVFLGRFDQQTDPSLTQRFLQNLDAPAKRTLWFQNSAHNIPFEEPERFISEVQLLLGDPAWLP